MPGDTAQDNGLAEDIDRPVSILQHVGASDLSQFAQRVVIDFIESVFDRTALAQIHPKVRAFSGNGLQIGPPGSVPAAARAEDAGHGILRSPLGSLAVL